MLLGFIIVAIGLYIIFAELDKKKQRDYRNLIDRVDRDRKRFKKRR